MGAMEAAVQTGLWRPPRFRDYRPTAPLMIESVLRGCPTGSHGLSMVAQLQQPGQDRHQENHHADGNPDDELRPRPGDRVPAK